MKKSVYTLCIVAITCLYILIYNFHPEVGDDFGFAESFDEFRKNPSLSSYWEGYRFQLYERFSYDNSRLGNIICGAIIALPRFIVGTICGVCVGLMLYFATRMAGVWKRDFVLFTLLSMLLLYVMPWFDGMLVCIFAFNYIVASVVLLVAADILINKKCRNIWAGLLLGLVVGAWHEIFGAAFCGGIVSLWIFRKEYRDRTALAMFFGAILGLVWLMLIVPGTQVRGGSVNLASLLLGARSLLYKNIPFAIFIVTEIWLLVRKSTRETALNPVLIFLSGGAVAAWIDFLPLTSMRAGWTMYLCVYMGFIMILHLFRKPVKAKAAYALCALLWAGCLAQSFVTMHWARNMAREMDMIVNMNLDPATRFVFSPYTTNFDVPLLTLGRPDYTALTESGYTTRLIPEELADFSPEKSVSVGVDCPVWRYKNHLVIPAVTYEEREHYPAELVFGGIYRTTGNFMLRYFEVDGKAYCFLCPWHLFFASKMGPVTEMRSPVIAEMINSSDNCRKWDPEDVHS